MTVHAICISRAIWTGAEAIATDVAKELGFRYVDEEIVNLAAERRNLDAATVASAERRQSFLAQLVGDISRGGVGELINYIPSQRAVPSASDDVRVVIRDAIRETANQGNVVIVAHAASYALGRRDDVLRVLLTGSPFVRATRWLTTSGGKSPREASETIAASDEARANYLKRFYNVDHEEPDHYDLTISTDKMSAAHITEMIVKAARSIEPPKQVAPASRAAGDAAQPGASA
ncbi:MAG TPA: cytidylate kinase-like family protein [Ramlibacter sp.]|nr:cytidylate kinase-like family protein [Ramlibacter sp.]